MPPPEGAVWSRWLSQVMLSASVGSEDFPIINVMIIEVKCENHS